MLAVTQKNLINILLLEVNFYRKKKKKFSVGIPEFKIIFAINLSYVLYYDNIFYAFSF